MFGQLARVAANQLVNVVEQKMNASGAGGGVDPAALTQQYNIPGEGPIMISTCKGNKKAVFVGINYVGTKSELHGCWNDVKNVYNFVTQKFGFDQQNCVVLTDEQKDAQHLPTKQNILNAMNWLVNGAQPGDSLFFHYSGHGGQTPDEDGDESDGMDETIYPVDHERTGMIVDDEMHNIMVKPLPAGVRLTAIFDSCHSGTVLDLPYVYNVDGTIKVHATNKKAAAVLELVKAGLAFQTNKAMAMSHLKEGFEILKSPEGSSGADKIARETKTSHADVIQFGGCLDSQTSADATLNSQATGAMSFALIQFLSANPNPTYTELLMGLQDILRGKFTQIPQMSAGRPMDLNTQFVM